MKITDNMLRVINHAYTTSTTTEFLIKTNIMKLEDKDIIVKALQVAAMISKLIQHIDTNVEKRFYAYLLPVEAYNKELIKERSTCKDIVTIKEFIMGNGLVYSEFLDYIYDSLAKYEFNPKSKEILATSLEKTHAKLQYILQLKGEVAPGGVDVEAIQKELEHIDYLAKEYCFDIEEESNKVELMATSIKSIKDTLGNLGFNIAFMPTLADSNISFNATTLVEEIDIKMKEKLEKQANFISNTVIEQLDCINIDHIEHRLITNIEEKIKDLIGNIITDISNKIGLITISNLKGGTVEEIASKISTLLNNVKIINSSEALETVVIQLNRLSDYLEDREVNNRAYCDLIEANIDNIKRQIR